MWNKFSEPRYLFVYMKGDEAQGTLQLTMDGVSRVLAKMFMAGDRDRLLPVGNAAVVFGDQPLKGSDR